jgi:RimJ/RimL family protein N-acetyltransferase
MVPLGAEHYNALTGWAGTAKELFAWAGPAFTFPLDQRQLERYVAESPACNRTSFVLLDPGDGLPAGHVGLSDVDVDQRSAYIVRLVVDPARRRSGVGTRLLTGALSHAFDELGLHRVEQRVLGSNKGALICSERLGFRRDGVLRDARRVNGRFEDFVVLSMLEHEWKP